MDCIYQGARSMYINPDECVDCGACKAICRMDAIYYEIDLPTDQHQHLTDNAAFFSETLPGRDGPLGSPGGAANLGPLRVDTRCRYGRHHRRFKHRLRVITSGRRSGRAWPCWDQGPPN